MPFNGSRKMFTLTTDLFAEKEKTETFEKIFSRIEKYENTSDRMELEIANYLNHLSSGNISSEGENKIHQMYKIVDEIESIGDSCYNIARTLVRKSEARVGFTTEINYNICRMFRLTEDALTHMENVLSKNEVTDSDINKAYNKEDEINNYRNQLKNLNLEDISKDNYNYQSGIYYMDVISECEKIGDYVINVLEAFKEKLRQ